jgi:hypothetical protein
LVFTSGIVKILSSRFGREDLDLDFHQRNLDSSTEYIEDLVTLGYLGAIDGRVYHGSACLVL